MRIVAAGLLSALLLVTPAAAQTAEETAAERDARMARRSAGARVGVWEVEPITSNLRVQESLHYEVYVQRAMDKHLALETSVSVWQRSSAPDAPQGAPETKAFIIPVFTSLKLYPFTTVEHSVDPYVTAGAGLALGIEDAPDATIGGGGGTSVVTGFGFKAGAGVEIHLSNTFGVIAGARYQVARFGDDVGADDTFKGLGFDGGLTYRFRF